VEVELGGVGVYCWVVLEGGRRWSGVGVVDGHLGGF
jgi:hypothetical protein